nr:protein FAR1-RELATED SEQUENCE 5-like [Setaria viridis]
MAMPPVAGIRGPDKREENSKYSRPETRCMCQARMKISLTDGLYYIHEFEPEHNHILATAIQAQYLRSQRRITTAQIVSVEAAKAVGISNKATFDLMAKEAGGNENLGFTREDMKNKLYSKRSMKVKQGDTGGVLEYLEKKASEDGKFFHSFQVDDDDLITNIFWADSKMVSDYEIYGDVVCFDTTYRKLNDGRPFGLLVGVNNHKKTTIFGAALLYDKTAESFVWLFKTFLAIMSGKKPKTILTDEDAAMAKAIKLVLPESHHRICIWHMNQNACKHLSGVVEEYKKFNTDFQNCIYDQEDEEDFINAWNNLLDKYKLQENKWLERLFDKREQWALAYGRNTFSADMVSTQRSESMNNELKGYISVKYDILTFFEHFDRLVGDKRYEEVKYDFKATQSTPKLKADLTILRHAAKIYTPAVFKLVQEQVMQTLNCDLFYSGDIDAEKVYKIKVYGKKNEHVVKFSALEGHVKCSCKKFEFAGILCCHALKILDINNIKKIPEQYILNRWTIDAKVVHIKSNPEIHEDPKIKLSKRRKELCRIFLQLANRAAESDETYSIAVNSAEKLAEDVEKSLKNRGDTDTGSSSQPQGLHWNTTCLNPTYATQFISTLQPDQAIKPKGVKVKEKAIHGSDRPIGGFEKATQKRKKNKNDPKTSSSASGFEKATRKRKKTNNDSKASSSAMESDIVTHLRPQAILV